MWRTPIALLATSAIYTTRVSLQQHRSNLPVKRSPSTPEGTGKGSTSAAASSRSPRFVTPGKRQRFQDDGSSAAFDMKQVKKRAPWGLYQLRDSWSEDAMTRRDEENLSARIHRAYRYHPEEFRRHHIKYAGLLALPCVILGACAGYYYHTGKPIWKGDPQELLNYIRSLDTSPRSELYAFRMKEEAELPDHVMAYRQAHQGEKERQLEYFGAIYTVFRAPNEEELRRIEQARSDREERSRLQVVEGTA